ncbi:copper homeostasis protein CutC [Parasediminibacterium paludis]|uniref:PF03932 family protein CutC n=1 Tax=Parasediminibacterium paludis TaxID=908966 RepID=A0ABV8PRW0_9BACT
MLLEVPVFNINSAIIAANNGADRLELCENYANGGTTPSYGVLKMVREKVSIPVNVLIIPTGGDFVYTDVEYAAMQQDILLCKELGFNGVVLGVLLPDGNIDIPKTKALVQLAYPMQVTFHRAFDRCINPYKGLEDIISCGCHRILTSGQKADVVAGKNLLQELVTLAKDRIIIMPGGGVKSSNMQDLINTINTKEYHASCKKMIPTAMDYINEAMQDDNNETSVDITELQTIKRLLQ